MRRIGRMYPVALTLLAACADGATAPSSAAAPAAGTPALKEQGAILTCTASATGGGYSVVVQWTRTPVRNVTLTLEVGSLTTALRHLTRKGSVTFTPSSQPIGAVLDDGNSTVGALACAAA